MVSRGAEISSGLRYALSKMELWNLLGELASASRRWRVGKLAGGAGHCGFRALRGGWAVDDFGGKAFLEFAAEELAGVVVGQAAGL